jgi:E3 ubiquitin-protein ligase RNF213
MVIDPTDNETAIWLLFTLGICDRSKTQICYSADFRDDATDMAQCEVILKVKNAMECGHTVIMVNSQSINGCFYDVFNCYFNVITGSDGKYHTIWGRIRGRNVFAFLLPN